MLGTMSSGGVPELHKFQGVYRRDPLSLHPLERKLQLLGAGSAAAHQDHPADGEGDPDDHPNRGEIHQTDHQGTQQSQSYNDAGSPCHDVPSAALDRVAKFLDLNLKSLDLLHRGRIRFEYGDLTSRRGSGNRSPADHESRPQIESLQPAAIHRSELDRCLR
jgi:hypothetical protein